MIDFAQYTFLGISLIVTLAFVGLLVLLCIRTRSKGLIIITVLVIFRSTIGLIPGTVMELFLDQWSTGKLNNWVTQNMTIGQFVMLYTYVTTIFYNGLLALGALLIYREWSRGQIRWNQQKSSEVVNHA